jgi:hypothetical protein
MEIVLYMYSFPQPEDRTRFSFPHISIRPLFTLYTTAIQMQPAKVKRTIFAQDFDKTVIQEKQHDQECQLPQNIPPKQQLYLTSRISYFFTLFHFCCFHLNHPRVSFNHIDSKSFVSCDVWSAAFSCPSGFHFTIYLTN